MILLILRGDHTQQEARGESPEPPVVINRWRLPAAAAITAVTASTAGRAARSLLARLGLVDRQGPATHHRTVQGVDRRFRLGIVFHLHEAEALGLARKPIGDDRDRGHLAGATKELFQILLRSRVGQSAHIQTLCHSAWLLSSLPNR